MTEAPRAARSALGAQHEANSRRWWFALIALLAIGVALRAANAWNYLLLFGYDSVHSWAYVEQLRSSWALPAHDASWSTNRPPLFFYIAAVFARAFGEESLRAPVVTMRLLGSGLGLLAALAAADLVRRAGGSMRRQALAVGLVALFPAHLLMSAMFNEEIWAAAFTALAVYATARLLEFPAVQEPAVRGSALAGSRAHRRFVVAAGITSGLALLTKLTGALAAITSVLAILLAAGLGSSGAARSARARSAIAIAAICLAMGAWFYLRHWVTTGTPWPSGYAGHSLMYSMPPGEREIGDYFRFPLATFTFPRATHPELLRSVWGTTYASLWFDAHRHFVPRAGAAIAPVGSAILVLGLLPSIAFFFGFAGGVRRSLASGNRSGGHATGAAFDPPLLILCLLTWAGFALYTWQNPWFATTKGHYLLGICLPFAYYASDALDRWLARPVLGWIVLAMLIALALLCALAFSFETPLWDWGPRPSGPGLPWRSPAGELLGLPR